MPEHRLPLLDKGGHALFAILEGETGLLHAALEQQASKGTVTKPVAERWQRVLRTSYETEGVLRANAQAKLALTNLMLNL